MSVTFKEFGEAMRSLQHYFTLLVLVLIYHAPIRAAEFANEEVENERFSENRFEQKESPVTLEYPELKKFLYIPPKAPVYVGLGAAPISLMGSKLFFNFSLFQVHYITDRWDIEIFSASIGQTKSDKAFANSRHFTGRFSPKYVFMDLFDTGKVSVGPLLGMEYVHFGSIPTKKARNGLTTPKYEDLTTSGYIYGLALSQTFTLAKDRKFKVSQMFYKQTYNIKESEYGWQFQPQDSNILDGAANQDEIAKKTVFLIDFAFLF
jgi:hypothetical protein